MQYELVQLSEKKTVAGVRMRTSNNDPDRKSTRLNSSHLKLSRMPSSA